jgi:hypothetical protein
VQANANRFYRVSNGTLLKHDRVCKFGESMKRVLELQLF